MLTRHADIGIPNHNVLERDGGLLFNDTNAGNLVAIDRELKAKTSIAVPGDPSFARGLAHWQDGLYLVGSQRPLAVHAIDVGVGRVTRTYELGGEENESVYAVAVLPDGFSEPTQYRSLFASATTTAEVS